jgi:hypothetical protein
MCRVIALVLIFMSFAFLCVNIGFTGSYDPSKMASDLWNKIQGDKYRETWELWPGKGKFYKGTEPHGMLLTTYLNEAAYRAVEKNEKELPNGSIVIKENYMPDKTLGAITVMQKIEKYNPEGGDWFWVKFKPDGNPETAEMGGKSMPVAGKVPMCIGCHQASNSGIRYIMTK